MGRRTILLGALALLVGAALVSTLGPRSSDPPVTPAGTPSAEPVEVPPPEEERAPPAEETHVISGRIVWPDGRPFETGDIEVAGGQLLDRPESPGGPLVEVLVKGPDGSPVRSAGLGVVVLGGFSEPQDRTVAVRNGRASFLLRFASRRILLTVHGAVGADGSAVGELAVGPVDVGRAPIDLTLPEERVLRGRVVGPDGKGIPGAWVTAGLLPPILSWVSFYGVGIHDSKAETGDDGGFEIRGLSAGRYWLAVEPPAPWVAPDSRLIEIDEDLIRIDLLPGVYPLITVLDPDGEPVPGCEVQVREGPLAYKDVPTGARGIARIGPLDPGREYNLHCHPPERGERETEPGDPDLPVEVPLGEATGRPLAEWRERGWRPADTVVRLAWLEAPERESQEPRDPDFEGDATLTIELTNCPRYVFPGAAEIRSEREGGGARKAYVSPWGVTIEGLAPDTTYTYRVVGVGDGLAIEAKGLRPGPDPVRLTLSPGLVIRGRIDLPPGADYAHVMALQGNLGVWWGLAAIVHADGRFEIPGLLPGIWRVKASASVGETWYGAEVDAEAGSEVRITPKLRGD